MSTLEVRGLVVHYGPIRALAGVDLEVAAGELVAITGANGAGKSTLLKTIAGVLRPSAGTIRLDGAAIARLPPQRLIQRGVGLVPEGRQPFAPLTVRENLVLGAYHRLGWLSARRVADDLARISHLFPVLGERQRQAAGTLSGGEQQMLAIGRALMARPRLLLCDEPSLGLAPLIVRDILRTLRTLCDDGMTVLLAEQSAHAAFQVANRGYVLETGRVALADSAAALRESAALSAAYLGGALDGGEPTP